MTLSERMLLLAERLETKATLSDSTAQDHEDNKEASLAKYERRRAQDAREFAADCRNASKLLKAREKRGKFVPPAFDEVWAYVKEQSLEWPMADVQKWYDHFNANGWKVGGKAQMADWKAAARNGARNWREKNPQRVSMNKDAEPEGWEQFLNSARMPWQPYKYAPAHLKNDFAKHLKQR